MSTPTQPTSPTNNLLSEALAAHAAQAKITKLQPAPHILVVGPTGKGKSTSIKSLPPAETFIINVENKILPFTNHLEFTNQVGNFSFVAEVDKFINIARQSPQIKYVVIDSFTKYLEMLMAEARARNKGYEIFNYYNTCIYNFLEMLKKVNNKIFILTCIDEIVKIEQDSGAMSNTRSLAVEGKVWAAKIEKEFSIVLFSLAKLTPGSNPPKTEYSFQTNTDGITSAKSPAGMFPYYIPNDLGMVVKKVEEYFGLVTTNKP